MDMMAKELQFRVLREDGERLTVRANRIPNESERMWIEDTLLTTRGIAYYVPRSWFATLAPHTHVWPAEHPEAVRIRRDEERLMQRGAQ